MVLERGVLWALVKRPALLVEAIRARWAMRRIGGVGMGPSYSRWRLLTAYGDDSGAMSGQDLLNYLSWRREMRLIRKWERV